MDVLHNVFENTTDAVFGTDKNMRVRFWNGGCQVLLGIERKNAIGRHCYELICGDDLLGNKFCSNECPVIEFYNKGLPKNNFDLVVKHKGGESVIVNTGFYYTGNLIKEDDMGIHHFHSMRTVDCHQLVRRLTTNSGRHDENNNIKRLSKREYEILCLLSSGVNAKNIAVQLCISHATVRNHMKSIYSKLEVHHLAEAINCAMRYGLV